jgi:hypothetical protein
MLGLSIVSDVLAAFSVPGGATLIEIAENKIQKRRDDATKLLTEQIALGAVSFDEADVDPFVSIVIRFARAVDEGVGRENLRLMAKVIVGLKKNRSLHDNSFARWAATLSDLTRDEIVAVGKAYALSKTPARDAEGNEQFWLPFKGSMEAGGYSEEQIIAICASVSRYGLLLPKSVWGGLIYHPSEWLVELGSLAELES